MMLPTISVAIWGVALLAALVAVDWYVWAATFASNLRLPKLAAQTQKAPAPTTYEERENAGFKHVA
jgi:hypothetical protein